VNADAAYDTKHYRIQFNLDNVFNHFYWLPVRNNQVVVPGIPINPRVTLAYKF
jgi:outer membrane receptor protein involved in Fe transport